MWKGLFELTGLWELVCHGSRRCPEKDWKQEARIFKWAQETEFCVFLYICMYCNYYYSLINN